MIDFASSLANSFVSPICERRRQWLAP